jgi:hypothetical protein
MGLIFVFDTPQNKNQMNRIFFFVASALTLFSCNKDILRGSGDIRTETRTVQTFHSIESHYDIAANVTYGATQELKVTGYGNLIDVLETTVENGVLKLKYPNRYSTVRNGNVVANITIPAINKLTMHGSKDATISGFANGTSLSTMIHGSGDIRVENSSFENASATIHGSGDVDAQGLQAKEFTTEIHGSGDVSISVTDTLRVTIHGSGNVNYWGNPVVETTVHGSGRVVKR